MKHLYIIASVLGASGIALGAFGAHALKDVLEASGHMPTWKTAVFYHMAHALGVFVIAQSSRCERLRWSAYIWTIGVCLFSGSLYGIALEGPSFLGPITPIGGLSFIVGWCLLLRGANKSEGLRNA